jgi:FkbM family methyltransferase
MEWFRISPRRMHDLFMAYSATFDPCEVVRRHAVAGLQPQNGRLKNFLGTVVDPAYFGELLDDKAGTIEPTPIPGNWHACISEWGACLRALDLARGSFTVVELGCGWGCWLNNMAVAAREAGFEYSLIGVEGDPDHRAFAKKMFFDNGIPDDKVRLHAGVAAAGEGVALFPRQVIKGKSWGLEPVFGASESQRTRLRESGRYDELPMVSVKKLVGDCARVDLMHIDIQGGEADLIEGALSSLSEKVAYIVVGTHARRIESRIREAMIGAGWLLEIERPAIYKLRITGPRLKVDGLQGWRNTRLLPVQAA